MPHIEGKPFERKDLVGVTNNTGVFVNSHSKEAFTSYKDFLEQAHLCLTPKWTCSISGRSDLTFQEASRSEEEAENILSMIQPELGIPILYVASRTECTRLIDMVHTVCNFIKDRYFLGEIVEVNHKGSWLVGYVYTIVQTQKVEPSTREYNANGFSYEVHLGDCEDSKLKLTVQAPSLRRYKDLVLEEIVHKYLALFTNKSDNGIWKIKEHILVKYAIQELLFSNFFCGHPPVFPKCAEVHKNTDNTFEDSVSPKQKNVRQSTLDEFMKHPKKTNVTSKVLPLRELCCNKIVLNGRQAQEKEEKKQKLKDEISRKQQDKNNKKVNKVVAKNGNKSGSGEKISTKKFKGNLPADAKKKTGGKQKLAEDQNAKKLSQKLKPPTQKKKVDKQKQLEEQNPKPKDLNIFPHIAELKCNIPSELFGDFMMVLEFFNTFKSVLPKMKSCFPSGVTFEVLERAIVVQEVGGPLYDILQLLLLSIFHLQGDEDEDLEEAKPEPSDQLTNEDDFDKAVRGAVPLKNSSLYSYGVPLKDLPLDVFSASEILRLHLLTSEGLTRERQVKWRLQNRGGYAEKDDPELSTPIDEPSILDILSCKSVSELSKADKLKVVLCLIHQILTYVSVREEIEKRWENVQKVKMELRQQLGELKKKKLDMKLKKSGEDKTEETDKPPETLDAEAFQDQLMKFEKEIARREQDVKKKAKKLSEIVRDFRNSPLGIDRDYRRYWVFTSLPGLFIEQEMNRSGDPFFDLSKDDAVQQLLEVSSECSNKENDVCDSQKYSGDKKLVSDSPSVGEAIPMWYFCAKEDEFLSLLKQLDNAHDQDSRLFKCLFNEKERILESIQSCPVPMLNPKFEVIEDPVPEVQRSTRRSTSHQKQWDNLGYPSEMMPVEIWYEVLRDEILNMEDALYCGGLGNIYVQDRLAWREALINRSYDKQCDRLVWELKGKSEQLSFHGYDKEFLKLLEAPYHFPDLSDPTVIKVLACAIMQIQQCIPKKFLKGEFNSLGRWEISVMKSTSFSQLYLHLMVLNNNVHWARSALKACCRICRRRSDAENMLLCDGCNKGYHTYCLKPKCTRIPTGDWYCQACQAQTAAQKRKSLEEIHSLRPKRQKTSDRCNLCGLGKMLSSCQFCSKPFHTECFTAPGSGKKTRNIVQCKECYVAKCREIKNRSF